MSTRTRTRTAPRERSRPICGGPLKRGGLCRRKPGQGTDHDGVGRCSLHGGNDPEELKKVLAVASMAVGGNDDILRDARTPVMGIPISMEPADALTWCVSIAAGEVAYLTMKVQELTDDDLTARPRTSSRESGDTEHGFKDLRSMELGPDALHLLIAERQKAVDRLARLSKMALDAGVAERQVRLAEQQGDMIVALIAGLMDDLELTGKQRRVLESTLPQRLLALESPSPVSVAP